MEDMGERLLLYVAAVALGLALIAGVAVEPWRILGMALVGGGIGGLIGVAALRWWSARKSSDASGASE